MSLIFNVLHYCIYYYVKPLNWLKSTVTIFTCLTLTIGKKNTKTSKKKLVEPNQFSYISHYLCSQNYIYNKIYLSNIKIYITNLSLVHCIFIQIQIKKNSILFIQIQILLLNSIKIFNVIIIGFLINKSNLKKKLYIIFI